MTPPNLRRPLPSSRRPTLVAALLAAPLSASASCLPAPAAPPSPSTPPGQRYVLQGHEVAVYNLAGEVLVQGGTGSRTTVEVRPGGRDAQALQVEVGRLGGRETLRILYPADRVVYRPGTWRGTVHLPLRRDGTWAKGAAGFLGLAGRRVRISHEGPGLEAHADLVVTVPPGKSVALYLGVGRIAARNVQGRILLDARAGPVEASQAQGTLRIAAGSGRVTVSDLEGDLRAETGSGSVQVERMRGGRLSVDTGSGRVILSEVELDRLEVETGSGAVRVQGVTADEVHLDTGSGPLEVLEARAGQARLETGSGSVTVHFLERTEQLWVATGSGSVTLRLPGTMGAQVRLETGSGGVSSEIPLAVRTGRRGILEGRMGDGRGWVRVRTGSGSVRLLSG